MSDIFTPEERIILKTAQENRLAMLSANFEGDNVPSTVGEQRVNNEILSGVEDSIFKQVKLRQTSERDKADQDATAIALSILNNMDVIPVRPRGANIRLDASYVPSDIVPGEGDINPAPITLNELGLGEDQ